MAGAVIPGTLQMGQGPSRGSVSYVTTTGPYTRSIFATVSFTVTVIVSVRPRTVPTKRAGTVGPIAIG